MDSGEHNINLLINLDYLWQVNGVSVSIKRVHVTLILSELLKLHEVKFIDRRG